MARIVVYSMAYRGDVHPYVPVATELSKRGHDVTFVVAREFHPEFAGEPFVCVHSGSDFSPTELDKHGEWLARWGMRFGGIRLLELYFGEFTVPHLAPMYEAVHDALHGTPTCCSSIRWARASVRWLLRSSACRGVPAISFRCWSRPRRQAPRRAFLRSGHDSTRCCGRSRDVPDRIASLRQSSSPRSVGVWGCRVNAGAPSTCGSHRTSISGWRAVVHSGAHGTNSMTLAARLPSVVMPSIFDQVWHTRRNEQLGTGVHVSTLRNLEAAIARLMSDTAMTERAAAFGGELATEDGVATATNRIEGFLRSAL